MELSPHSLTPRYAVVAFVVWLGSLSSRPLAHPVPYLRNASPRAAPKCISGRTSYLRVRLAFHPYPQVIPHVFNHGGFGPPRGLTPASTCPWVDHSASGLQHATERPVQTRFRYGYARCFASPVTVTSRLIMQKARGRALPEGHSASTACRCTVSGTFNSPNRGAFHLSLTVLVHYRSQSSI